MFTTKARVMQKRRLSRIVIVFILIGLVYCIFISKIDGTVFVRLEGKETVATVQLRNTSMQPLANNDVSKIQEPCKKYDVDCISKEESNILLREQLLQERTSLTNQACMQFNRTHEILPKFRIAQNHGIVYCGIPKTGSTFWSRTLRIIENQQKISSLYEFRNSELKLTKLPSLAEFRSSTTELVFKSFLENAISFMFVREPYGKIFSAYNNKILNPNMMYWNMIGRKVISAVRTQPSEDSLTYGHDVTFTEMIQYLVLAFEHGNHIDQHFAPLNRKCNPCNNRFDYIGKMESFADDARFIIAKLRQKYKDVYIRFDDFDSETAFDTMQGHVGFLFGVLKHTQGIKYPQYNFFLRTWRDMQIRGYLSKYIDMPLTKDQVSNITKEDFFSVIKDALLQPMNKTEVKQQRKEALAQAYRRVPLQLMERLRKYVQLDCDLFGYDSRPALLFDRGSVTDDKEFDYFDDI